MFNPERLWYVQAELVGPTSWLVIADSEEDAKDAAEELEMCTSIEWGAMPAGIKDGVLVSVTDMSGKDDVVIAHPEKDDEVTLSELLGLIAEWYQQKQREYRERNNGQTELPLC
jgi:hypothetical protein